jgi:serpin B
VSIANKLFINQGFSVKPDYKQIMQNVFMSDIDSLDFSNQPEAARQTMNDWVLRQTRDKIRDLFPPGDNSRDEIVL